MVNSRSELTLSLLLFSALCLEAFIIELEVFSPAQRMNWSEARLYCQRNHVDLVAGNIVDISGLNGSLLNLRQVWMGLRRVPRNDSAWRWIDPKGGEGVSGGDFSQSVLWAQGEPRYADCGSFDPVNQKFYSKACSTELPFLCYDDNLVVVNENKTWEDALKHCRKMESPCEDEPSPCIYKHDLLSLEVLVEYNYVRDRIYKATTDEVWTSLRFLGGEWRWSNGQQLEDQTMLPDCPSQWKHCGTLSKHDTNHWITRNCLERRNFICYRYKTVSNQTDYLGV
ncbi:hypothetical protein OYC64_015042 [Pagothenia borchgrevinki]|uniref:C-type lectin domain-containing protein n=1 Tax=Pagothenia borchgrevinki TaxID=8213 RepID=A0ABD2H2L2_PAGBO